jgi:hypothetical protein
MSWIKENKFLAGLAGGTLVVVACLYIVGFKGAGKYAAAKEDFDSAAQEASTFEKLPLYPSKENLDSKTKALDEYRKSVESLQAAFEAYRPKEMKNISPQAFTDELKKANDETRAAFGEKIVVPDAYFVGFEPYKTSLAPGKATGILEYELNGIKNLMLELAASGITELKNLHRPELPEEQGRVFDPNPNQAARQLPLEITFQGSEQSVRAFVSAVVKTDDRYVVIRSLRITNTKKDPPRTSDAEFEQPAAVKPAGVDSVFGDFQFPGEESPVEGEKPEEKEAAPAPAPPADSSRILVQVLGDEELQVFLRLDLMEFLPAKKLP